MSNVTCTYCGRAVTESELSAEHVIPRRLARIEPHNPFMLRTVCARCNSACGRHVDAPFLKSWTAQNATANSAINFSELTQDTALPLCYMGEIESLKQEPKVCDFWMGPTGDRIYHFHAPYEQDAHARVAVGLPQWGPKEKFDPGFVFVAIHSILQPWPAILINSLFETFPDSEFFVLNAATPSGMNRRGQHFSDIPPELGPLKTVLAAMNGQEHRVKTVIFTDAPDRFMAKVTLGFGALFLAPSFSTSPAANKLRSALWTRSAAEREKIRLRGRKFLGEADPLKWLVNLPGCHTVAGLTSGNHFMLLLRMGETEAYAMEVSDEPAHWAGTPAERGIVFVIAPGFRSCVGPLTQQDLVFDYCSRTDPKHGPHPELEALRCRLQSPPPRPPME